MQHVKFVGFYFNSVRKGKDVKSMTSAHLRKPEKKKRGNKMKCIHTEK